MSVEWDPVKAEANFRKHGVRFADALTALEDDNGITIRDDAETEDRWITIGMDCLGRVLVVVYTWRGDRVRLISARQATSAERRQYRSSV